MFRYRLRSLLILLGILPPALWGVYLVLSPPGRLVFAASLLVALLLCAPFAILRLKMIRMK